MKKLNDIQSVYDAEIILIQKQSALLLQNKTNGFNGELKTAGAITENYIKGLLQNHLPNGYRICSGYIATSESISNTKNLIQHDIIIVDDRIPSLYKFGVSDIEIIAAEAVCGVIEVKRTLTKKSLSAAIHHLEITKNTIDAYDQGVKSKDKSANGFNGNLYYSTEAPLYAYAVIGLDAQKEITETEFLEAEVIPAVNSFIDLIWSPAAPYIIGLEIRSGDQRRMAYTASRKQEGCAHFTEGYDTVKKRFDKGKSGLIFRGAISCFRTWVNNSSGARMTPEKNFKYFGM